MKNFLSPLGRIRAWRAPDAGQASREAAALAAAHGAFGDGRRKIAEALRRERARIGRDGYDVARHAALARLAQKENAARPVPRGASS